MARVGAATAATHALQAPHKTLLTDDLQVGGGRHYLPFNHDWTPLSIVQLAHGASLLSSYRHRTLVASGVEHVNILEIARDRQGKEF